MQAHKRYEASSRCAQCWYTAQGPITYADRDGDAELLRPAPSGDRLVVGVHPLEGSPDGCLPGGVAPGQVQKNALRPGDGVQQTCLRLDRHWQQPGQLHRHLS